MDEKTELLGRLRQNRMKVTFKKADGTLRVMRCSLLKADLDNALLFFAGARQSANSDEDDPRIIVWDLDKADWRSFNADTVVSAREL